jgi:hypothetical protein
MYSRIFLSAVVVSVLNTFSGCATQDVAAPGISSKEMNVLVSNYYYQVVPHEQRYTSEQLNELFRASDNPTLDGEAAELQTARVAIALASVGDERFSQAFSHHSASIKQAVARNIEHMWTLYHLYYPKTQRVLRPYT